MPKWTDYTTKTTVADNDEIMTLDTAGKANKRLSLSILSDWVLGKIADKVFEKLQTNDKTILGAINELNSKRGIMSYHGRSFSSRYARPYISKSNKYDEPGAILVIGYEGVGVLKFSYMGLQKYPTSYGNLYDEICKTINSKIVVDFSDKNRQITFITPEGIELALEEVNGETS